MKKIIKTGIFLLLLPFGLSAQVTIDSVLKAVERNNTTLTALRKSVDAEKIGNQTGMYLQNPEFEFNYLWGSPTNVGNRTDVNIRQSFDFPTAYDFRRQIADSRNQQAELEYQRQRNEILYNARILCTEIVYANALHEEYSKRLAHAQEIADAYQALFDKGQVNVLELNKARLNLLNIKNEVETHNIGRTASLQQLYALNGGQVVDFSESNLPPVIIPSNFDEWYSKAEKNNPFLQWLRQEIEVSQKQEKLNRALSLPKASAGYMSEKVVGEHFQGVTLGVTIPLWENKNTVKYLQTQSLALQSMETDSKLQFYNQLKIEFERAASLQKTVTDYRQALQSSNNADLLKKALDKGEISLIDYLMEMSFTYSAVDNLLKYEYEMNRALSLLAKYEM